MRFTHFMAVFAACGIITTPQACSLTELAIDHSYEPMNLLQLDGDSHADALSDAPEEKLAKKLKEVEEQIKKKLAADGKDPNPKPKADKPADNEAAKPKNPFVAADKAAAKAKKEDAENGDKSDDSKEDPAKKDGPKLCPCPPDDKKKKHKKPQ